HAILRTGGGSLLEWGADLPSILGIDWGEFRRGFVETIGVSSPGNLVQKGARVAAAIPLLGVALHDRENLPALARSPLFARIRRLRIVHGRSLRDAELRTRLA